MEQVKQPSKIIMVYNKKEKKEDVINSLDEEKFVTKEDFNKKFESLEGSVMKLVEMLDKKAQESTVSPTETKETINQREINDAKANQTPVSPVWEEKALEILGEYLDHCEVFYPKEGGTHFTVVIKREMSNAPKDYLERMKQDRRTREVSRDGLEGVIKWCNLVKQNLTQKK